MANLKEWLLEAELTSGEDIIAIVVGQHYDTIYNRQAYGDENVILSRFDGLRKVDGEFGNGFGGADCHPLYAWTENHIFFVHEYDGATALHSIPRHPKGTVPDFGGSHL